MGYSQRRTEQGYLPGCGSYHQAPRFVLGCWSGTGTSFPRWHINRRAASGAHTDSSLVAQGDRKVGSGSHGLGGWQAGFWIHVGCVVLEAGSAGMEAKVGQTG